MTASTGSRAAVPDREPEPRVDPSAPAGAPSRARRRVGGIALAFGAYLFVQCLQLLLVRHWAPRFFWFDDSQAQFGPMTWWLGGNADGGRPPLMDSDLGMGGNFVADMQ